MIAQILSFHCVDLTHTIFLGNEPFYGSALVPFVNRFPKDTKLYSLMTTRPGEGKFSGQAT